MATDTATGDDAPEKTLFSATLTPHRSLSPTGFRIVMALVIAGALIQAVPMLMLGAWPVGWFFGLDVAILYLCFRLSYARGRATEHVRLTRVELLIRCYTVDANPGLPSKPASAVLPKPPIPPRPQYPQLA